METGLGGALVFKVDRFEEMDVRTVKEILHMKREVTESHIKQLQQEGREGVRYTAMMPDIPFLVLGIVCDAGWIIHLIAGIIYFRDNGCRYALDWIALLTLAGVMFGVVVTPATRFLHIMLVKPGKK